MLESVQGLDTHFRRYGIRAADTLIRLHYISSYSFDTPSNTSCRLPLSYFCYHRYSPYLSLYTISYLPVECNRLSYDLCLFNVLRAAHIRYYYKILPRGRARERSMLSIFRRGLILFIHRLLTSHRDATT